MARAFIDLKVTGVERLQARAVDERVLRKPLRKLMRQAGQVVKQEYVSRARGVSRRVARRVRVKLRQGKAPAYITESIHVMSRYGGAPAIVSGRRVAGMSGARGKPVKMPPVGALRGGFAAARLVATRGIPGRPFVEATFATVKPRVESLLRDGTREIEAAWRS